MYKEHHLKLQRSFDRLVEWWLAAEREAVQKTNPVNPVNMIVELSKDERAFLHYLVTMAGEQPEVFGGRTVRLDVGAKRLYLAMVDRLRRKLS